MLPMAHRVNIDSFLMIVDPLYEETINTGSKHFLHLAIFLMFGAWYWGYIFISAPLDLPALWLFTFCGKAGAA